MTFTSTVRSDDTINPVCNFQYSDADGDGFGWENDTSCVVTEDSEPPPTFINEETGQIVDLLRTYWDGNNDIANRTIKCDLYYFDDVTGSYSVGSRFLNWSFNHLPIPSVSPYLGWLSGWRTSGPPWWTVADGLYRGEIMLTEEYFEPITHTNGAKAIRIWVNEGHRSGIDSFYSESWVEEDGFYQCWDTSGADFTPTGQPGQQTAVEYQLEDLTLTGPASTEAQTQDEAIINLETGQPVVQQKVYWDYNNDVAGNTVGCSEVTWLDGQYEYSVFNSQIFYRFNYYLEGSDNLLLYHWQFEGIVATGAFEFENGRIINSPHERMFPKDYAEIIEDGVRYWGSSEYFISCHGATPNGSAPIGNTDESLTQVSDTQVSNSQTESDTQTQTESTQEQGQENPNTVITDNQSGGGGTFGAMVLLLLFGLVSKSRLIS